MLVFVAVVRERRKIVNESKLCVRRNADDRVVEFVYVAQNEPVHHRHVFVREIDHVSELRVQYVDRFSWFLLCGFPGALCRLCRLCAPYSAQQRS